MSRSKVVVILLLIIALGGVFGWFLQQWWDGRNLTSPVEVTEDGAAIAKPLAKSGYCCVELGKECLPAQSAGECFRSAGKAFNPVERNCDYYCANAKQ